MVYQTLKHQYGMLTIRCAVSQGDEDVENALIKNIVATVKRPDACKETIDIIDLSR